jgi:hypothetical protein
MIRHKAKFRFTYSEIINPFAVCDIIVGNPAACRGKLVKLMEDPDSRRLINHRLRKLEYPDHPNAWQTC